MPRFLSRQNVVLTDEQHYSTKQNQIQVNQDAERNTKIDTTNSKLDDLKNQQDGVIGAINNTTIGDGTLGQRTYVYAHDVSNGQARALKCDASGRLECSVDALEVTAETINLNTDTLESLIGTTNTKLQSDLDFAGQPNSIGDGSNMKRVMNYGYDSAGGQQRPLKIDADGHLQVDILSTSAAAGSATLSEQQTQTGHLSEIEGAVENLELTVGTDTATAPTRSLQIGGKYVDGTFRDIKVDNIGKVIIDSPAGSDINTRIDAITTAVGTSNTKLNGGLPSALSSDQLKVEDAGAQFSLGLIGSAQGTTNTLLTSLDSKANTRDGHLNNIVNQTSGLASESTLGDIDTKLDDRLPPALTTAGNIKVSIEEEGGLATESTLADAETHLGAIETNTQATTAELGSVNTLLVSVDGKIPAKGQAAMASSTPVVIASNQSAIAVDGSAVTQPVSASSLPLPTGAATESSLSSIDGKITACDTGSIAGSVTANAGTNLNTSALALETTLSSLNGKVTACDTGSIAGSVTANAGTNLNTSALALESTLSSLNGKVTACDTGSVTISAALPAGTNNIGDVDIASALPTGSNTIGKVNVGTFDNAVTIQDGGNSITIDGAVTANAGTNLNTSALALETGGNLATIAGDTTSLDSKITKGYDAQVASGGDGLQQVLLYGRDNSGNLDAVKVTANGDVEVEIADFVKGNTTASASFPVTDASKKVKDVVWMSTELISSNTMSSSVLDCEGYSNVMVYGEQTAGTNVISNDLKILGSNTSGGTYYHIGSNLSASSYISGRNMLSEGTPLLYGNHARYLKVYNNTPGSVTITLRAVLSDFHEYQ